MKRERNTGISFFQRYLTVWVIICMALGILIGKLHIAKLNGRVCGAKRPHSVSKRSVNAMFE